MKPLLALSALALPILLLAAPIQQDEEPTGYVCAVVTVPSDLLEATEVWFYAPGRMSGYIGPLLFLENPSVINGFPHMREMLGADDSLFQRQEENLNFTSDRGEAIRMCPGRSDIEVAILNAGGILHQVTFKPNGDEVRVWHFRR
jgi:hypothetical protein